MPVKGVCEGHSAFERKSEVVNIFSRESLNTGRHTILPVGHIANQVIEEASADIEIIEEPPKNHEEEFGRPAVMIDEWWPRQIGRIAI